jgi:hypothetical protein
MKPTTNESTTRRWTFDHHHLVAFDVSKKAMVLGMRISADLPKGYGKLKGYSSHCTPPRTVR